VTRFHEAYKCGAAGVYNALREWSGDFELMIGTVKCICHHIIDNFYQFFVFLCVKNDIFNEHPVCF